MRHLTAKADIDLITDPVRAITPGGITYKTDPAVFLKADTESVKSIILYAGLYKAAQLHVRFVSNESL